MSFNVEILYNLQYMSTISDGRLASERVRQRIGEARAYPCSSRRPGLVDPKKLPRLVAEVGDLQPEEVGCVLIAISRELLQLNTRKGTA